MQEPRYSVPAQRPVDRQFDDGECPARTFPHNFVVDPVDHSSPPARLHSQLMSESEPDRRTAQPGDNEPKRRLADSLLPTFCEVRDVLWPFMIRALGVS